LLSDGRRHGRQDFCTLRFHAGGLVVAAYRVGQGQVTVKTGSGPGERWVKAINCVCEVVDGFSRP
jgi:hypothetical protein